MEKYITIPVIIRKSTIVWAAWSSWPGRVLGLARFSSTNEGMLLVLSNLLLYCSTVISLFFLPIIFTLCCSFQYACAIDYYRMGGSKFSILHGSLDIKRPTLHYPLVALVSKAMAINGELTASQMGMLMQDDDEELLVDSWQRRDIIESNRVKLTSYIHDITTLFPLLRQEGIFTRDDVEIIEAPVTTTAKVDKCLDVLLRKGKQNQPSIFTWRNLVSAA